MNSSPALPKDFAQLSLSNLDLEAQEIALILEALEQAPQTALRLNPLKTKGRDLLAQIDPKAQAIPWTKTGYWLSERPNFALDPAWHAGAYYVQEAGSMLVESVLEQINLPADSLVLDLCAAPGGKTTLLVQNLGPQALVVANEVIHSRNKILDENLIRWGQSQVLVCQNDPEQFRNLKACFDFILCDLPCSGEGLFRKQPQSRLEWSPQALEHCAARGLRILDAAVQALKPQGYLLLSTCTFNTLENEGSLAALCQKYPNLKGIRLDFPQTWPLHHRQDQDRHFYRCLPHLSPAEGFSFCLLQNQAEEQIKPRKSIPKDSPWRKIKAKDYAPLLPYVKEAQCPQASFVEHPQTKVWHLFHETLAEHGPDLATVLRLKRAGLPFGQWLGSTWKFSPEAAFSSSLAQEHLNFPCLDLSLNQALALLRLDLKELEPNSPKGELLLRYQTWGLAWAKNLGNRLNAHYPKAWQLRS